MQDYVGINSAQIWDISQLLAKVTIIFKRLDKFAIEIIPYGLLCLFVYIAHVGVAVF